jgi:hypothetical protein
MTFNDWMKEPENKSLLEDNKVQTHIAQQIWDAAKVEAINEYMGLIISGKLKINLDK